MKVAIIGSGYVGLVSAVCLALKGHHVTAIDINQHRVEQLKKGVVPFYEPGLGQGLKECLVNGRVKISSLIEDASQSEVILICVQTPPKKDGSMDLTALELAASNLAKIFARDTKRRVVVIRSTVVPGTTENFITPIFSKSRTDLVFNPEFLREGSAMEDFLNPDRIVIGTNSKRAKAVMEKLYAPFKALMINATPSTAEMAKYTFNVFLATLISFSNEIARICEKTEGTDVEDVLRIVYKDRRFIPSSLEGITNPSILLYLKAGCGFGGSCLPKDLSALIAYAKSVGQDSPLLKSVEAVNAGQAIRIADMAINALGGLDKKRVTVLGAAFKGGTDDLRESPGLRIIQELLKRKAKVVMYDPLVGVSKLKEYSEKGVFVAESLTAALEKSDLCIITSNAPQFKKLGGLWKSRKYKNLKVIDGRRILKVPKNRKNGFYAVGRSIVMG